MNPSRHVNPYIAGSPVSGTEMFYGREDVFSFIRRNLIGQHRDTPIVLYGQRRTGKTSVLYQLHRHLDPNYRCIFIDLHGLNLDGMGNLLLGIANSISRGLRRDYQLSVDDPDSSVFLADPRSAFEAVFLDGVLSALGDDHLVLMLDEMVRLDEEVRAGRLDREVFDYLRHLMQHQARLNFIFSLGSGLEEMEKDYAFMFSVSLYHRISFLEPAAARQLITEPARDHYQVAPQAVAKILEITSGHPYYTQLVCHCLFDLWSRSPKPVLDIADVYAVLAEAIELGSANLTYVWEDSAPEDQALMAGMAAAMRSGISQVTADQVRNAWRKIDVSLPERPVARALRSLTAREIVADGQAYSFTVDLQRLWLEKHRRLDWVKDALADPIEQWNRDARATRRVRYLAATAAVVILAGYLVASSIAHVFPFPNPAQGLSPMQSLTQLLPGDLSQKPAECHTAQTPAQWEMPGLVLALQCTDPGLAGGNVYAYQLDNAAHFQAAWRNFNKWWHFPPASTLKTCPPAGASYGTQVLQDSDIAQGENWVKECGLQHIRSKIVPAYAWGYVTSDAFVVAQGAPGLSYSALVSWVTQKSASRLAGVAPLTELLPADIDDPASQCSAAQPKFTPVGLVQSYDCNDPGLPNGAVDAYQMNSYANYLTTWAAFNQWWGFTSYTPGSTCPPPGSDHATAEGTIPWHDKYFPTRQGQVLECEWTGTGNNPNDPAYAWTLPTENAFFIAWGADNTKFASLQTWWANNVVPFASPAPVPPSP